MASIGRTFATFLATGAMTVGFAAQALAAPAITGVSGSFAHGSSMTITGSGFGTKNPAAPILWVDGETGNASDFFHELLPKASGSSYNTMFRGTIRGEGQVHSRSTRYLAGAHYPGTDSEAGYNVSAYINTGGALSRSFVSFYYKVDSKFADALSFTAEDNYKLLTYQNNSPVHYGGCGTGCSYWYWSNYGVNAFTWKAPDWKASSKTDGSGVGYPGEYGGGWTHVPGQWIKIETVGRHATSGGGASFQAFVNGMQVHSQSGYNEPFTVYGIAIGGFFRPYGSTDSWRYFDDIYIDNTWARVILGNASTWSASTIREPQIPSAWSNTSITVTINQGRIASLGDAYLYVVDASGNVNTNGFRLCTSCPTPPQNLRVQ